MRTFLVSCVSRKVGYPAPAKDLYISDWFRKARDYAFPNPWFILSAKFGLVPPQKVIPPYEETLLRMDKMRRQVWSRKVAQAIRKNIQPPGPLVFLAGDRYREFLVAELEKDGYKIEVPMRLLPIGKQLQWLKENRPQRSLF